MKKNLLIFLICMIPLQTFAFEDYIILSDTNVDFVYSSNEDIVKVVPFYTIDNSKKSIFLKAENIGKTSVIISRENDEKVIDIEISDNKTILSKNEGLTYFPLDIPQGGR